VLKVLCKKIGIQRLDLAGESAVLTFSEKTGVKPEKITALIQKDPQRFRLAPDHVLQAKVLPDVSTDPVEATKKVLQELA